MAGQRDTPFFPGHALVVPTQPPRHFSEIIVPGPGGATFPLLLGQWFLCESLPGCLKKVLVASLTAKQLNHQLGMGVRRCQSS